MTLYRGDLRDKCKSGEVLVDGRPGHQARCIDPRVCDTDKRWVETTCDVFRRVPPEHLSNLSVRFVKPRYASEHKYWHTDGIYHPKTERNPPYISLKAKKTLGKRTPLHELGHHVYNMLSDEQQKTWQKATMDRIPRRIPSRTLGGFRADPDDPDIHRWRAEEYFAELYLSKHGGRLKPKISDVPDDVEEVFNELETETEIH